MSPETYLQNFLHSRHALRLAIIPQTSETDSRNHQLEVLSDINAVSVVMPTALIGTVLLTLRGRGVGKSELIRRVEWLSERVRNKGGRVAHFAGAPTDIVDRGLEVLGSGLVGVVDGLPETTYYAVDRFQLSFYRNMTIHLFISEALVSVAMYTRVKQGGGPDNQRILFDRLFDQVCFVSQVRFSPFNIHLLADDVLAFPRRVYLPYSRPTS